MSIRGAARVGLFIALIAAAWFGVQIQGSLAQTQSSDSPSESAKVPPQKESAPRKEAGSAIAMTLPLRMVQASATAAAEESCAPPIRASVGSRSTLTPGPPTPSP